MRSKFSVWRNASKGTRRHTDIPNTPAWPSCFGACGALAVQETGHNNGVAVPFFPVPRWLTTSVTKKKQEG